MHLNAKHPEEILKYIKVFLNGEATGYIHEFDTKEGWIKVYTLNDKNQIAVDNAGDPQIFTLYGKVEVRLVDQ